MEKLSGILWLPTLKLWLFELVSWYDLQNVSLINVIFEYTSWSCMYKSVVMPHFSNKISCASLFPEINVLIRKWMSTGINILHSWYWLVTINMKSFLDIIPSIKVFFTYLTYQTLILHTFYPSLQCLHNPI